MPSQFFKFLLKKNCISLKATISEYIEHIYYTQIIFFLWELYLNLEEQGCHISKILLLISLCWCLCPLWQLFLCHGKQSHLESCWCSGSFAIQCQAQDSEMDNSKGIYILWTHVKDTCLSKDMFILILNFSKTAMNLHILVAWH